MDLSVIIINWNTADMLRDCLQSTFAGLGTLHAEVIVVDNASTDGSAAMVRTLFPAVKLICNRDNRGFAAANNQALRAARGRYCLLLNSDTLVHGQVLPASIIYMDMDNHSHIGALGCRVLNRDGTIQPSTSQFPGLINLLLQTSGLDRFQHVPALQRYRMPRWQRTTARDVETVSGCYLLVRRSVIDSVGLLDEAFFFFGEEVDWCQRIRRAGWTVRFAPVGDITHYGGGSSTSLNARRDIMLTAATVRLHRKHRGLLSALAAYLVLAVFNLSRALYWSLVALCGAKDHARHRARTRARERARHFRGVVAAIAQCWPSMPKGADPSSGPCGAPSPRVQS